MKDKIHPAYIKDARVVCNCGNTFTTGSTKKTIQSKSAQNAILFSLANIVYGCKSRVDKFQNSKKSLKISA
jgi:LSU ribosomal protein L31P